MNLNGAVHDDLADFVFVHLLLLRFSTQSRKGAKPQGKEKKRAWRLCVLASLRLILHFSFSFIASSYFFQRKVARAQSRKDKMDLGVFGLGVFAFISSFCVAPAPASP
jgi:hypothetical protein